MGGRADAWVDRDQQEKEGQLEILRDKAGSVDVYRPKQSTPGAGFTAEVREPVFYKTIEARIDNSAQEPDRAVDQEATEQQTLVGLTDDIDVAVSDIWKWNNLAGEPKVYRVIKILPIQAGNQVHLDELRKQAWPRFEA